MTESPFLSGLKSLEGTLSIHTLIVVGNQGCFNLIANDIGP